MLCPICKVELAKAILHNVEIDYCPECLGTFFQENELRWAKDAADKNLIWQDIDLWKDEAKFKISRLGKLCPYCRMPLYEVNYGKSQVKVDVCNLCQGIWLDRGEFKKIIEYLKKEGDWKVLEKYAENIFQEFWEIFTGPETFREEILDFLTLLKLFNYKFITQHPIIAKIISNLPKL